MTPADVVARIREQCGTEATLHDGTVHLTVLVERWVEHARVVKQDLGCRYFNWLSAVDWKEQGLEVLCRVENLIDRVAVVLRVRLALDDLHCPTVSGLWRGAIWMERECYDMFGIVFDGHPDPRRILLPDDWEGHPLRKDYAVDTPHPPYR